MLCIPFIASCLLLQTQPVSIAEAQRRLDAEIERMRGEFKAFPPKGLHIEITTRVERMSSKELSGIAQRAAEAGSPDGRAARLVGAMEQQFNDLVNSTQRLWVFTSGMRWAQDWTFKKKKAESWDLCVNGDTVWQCSGNDAVIESMTRGLSPSMNIPGALNSYLSTSVAPIFFCGLDPVLKDAKKLQVSVVEGDQIQAMARIQGPVGMRTISAMAALDGTGIRLLDVTDDDRAAFATGGSIRKYTPDSPSTTPAGVRFHRTVRFSDTYFGSVTTLAVTTLEEVNETAATKYLAAPSLSEPDVIRGDVPDLTLRDYRQGQQVISRRVLGHPDSSEPPSIVSRVIPLAGEPYVQQRRALGWTGGVLLAGAAAVVAAAIAWRKLRSV